MDTVLGLKEKGGLNFICKNGVFPLYGPDDKPEFETFKKRLKQADHGSFICPNNGAHKLTEAEEYNGIVLKCPDCKNIQGVKIDGAGYCGFSTPFKRIHVYVEEWEKYGFEPMPYYWPIPQHQNMSSDELVMTNFKVNVHVQSRTSACKWLSEIYHANPAWINTKPAQAKGIKEGDLIRVTSKIGYLVTKAHLTEGIHPRVAAISTSAGHWRYRAVSQAKKNMANLYGNSDPDVQQNMWWTDNGVHPNRIIPISTDPIGGWQSWYDTVVKVEKAKPTDKYQTVVFDLDAGRKAYHEMLQYATKKRSKGGGGH